MLDVTGRWSIEDGPLGRTDVLTYDYLEDGLTYQESILEYDYPGADLPDRDDTDGRERFLDGREAIDGASDETEADPYASKSFQEVPSCCVFSVSLLTLTRPCNISIQTYKRICIISKEIAKPITNCRSRKFVISKCSQLNQKVDAREQIKVSSEYRLLYR